MVSIHDLTDILDCAQAIAKGMPNFVKLERWALGLTLDPSPYPTIDQQTAADLADSGEYDPADELMANA